MVRSANFVERKRIKNSLEGWSLKSTRVKGRKIRGCIGRIGLEVSYRHEDVSREVWHTRPALTVWRALVGAAAHARNVVREIFGNPILAPRVAQNPHFFATPLGPPNYGGRMIARLLRGGVGDTLFVAIDEAFGIDGDSDRAVPVDAPLDVYRLIGNSV